MVKVEKLSENRVKLIVTVSAEDFDIALDKAFEKVVKEVKVDGFRPGKLPKKMFIERFGYEALYSDAVEFAFQATYPMALAESKVYPTADPKVDLDKDTKIEKGASFNYIVEVDVWPEIHLGDYKGLKVKKDAVKVTKKDIDDKIASVLKDKAENVIKEDAAAIGDTVVIDFEGFIDGVAFEGGKGENHPLELGSNSFIPGFEDQLVGVKSEEDKDVVVTFPENYQAKDLAGKEATFKCHVHEVKTKEVPELNDDFVAELEIKDVTTVDAYKEYIKNELTTERTTEAENKFEQEIIDAVCANSFADFPASLIANGVERQIKGLEDQAKQYGIPAEVLLQYYGVQSLEDYKKTVEENLRKQYLQELVFDKIVELEKLTASEKEVEAKYFEFASGDANKVAQLKKQYSPAQIEYQIKIEKAIKFMKDNVASGKKEADAEVSEEAPKAKKSTKKAEEPVAEEAAPAPKKKSTKKANTEEAK